MNVATVILSVRSTLQSPGLYSIWMRGSNGSSVGTKVMPKSRERNSLTPPISDTSPVSITWNQTQRGAVREDRFKQGLYVKSLKNWLLLSPNGSPCPSDRGWWRCQTHSGWRCGWSGESHRWMSSHSLHWHSDKVAVRPPDHSYDK